MKKCTRCEIEKELSEFNWKSKAKGIQHTACKNCLIASRKKFYDDNKDKVKLKVKSDKKSKVEWFNTFKKTLKCVKCGENHIACLDFHHIDPDKKEFTFAKAYRSLSIEKIKEEISKCIVVCSNCHRKIHYAIRNNSIV